MLRFNTHSFTQTFAAMALALLFLLEPAAFAAQPQVMAPCANRAEIVAKLKERFGEQRRNVAVTTNGQLFEVFVSDNGSWTALVSSPDGKACVILVGEGWSEEKQVGGKEARTQTRDNGFASRVARVLQPPTGFAPRRARMTVLGEACAD
jgi:hypothetical protein